MTATTVDELPVVDERLLELSDEGWHSWPIQNGIVRRLDDTRYVAVIPFLFTHAIVVGEIRCPYTYDDRWCYHSSTVAVFAASTWDGEGEPYGWHRHPITGRRREGGDPATERVDH